MVDSKLWCVVFFANGKGGASNFVGAFGATHKSACKRRFATAEVTNEFYYFTTTQITSERYGELLGLFGTGRFGLPCHVGIHIYHMLPRERLPLQAPQREWALLVCLR